MSPAEWLELVESKGPGLRAVGVLSIAIGDMSATFTLAAPDPAPSASSSSSTAELPESLNPLDAIEGYTLREEP